MMVSSRLLAKLLALCVVALFLNSCKTPDVTNVEKFEETNPLVSKIQLIAGENFSPDELTCIAVGSIVDDSNSEAFKSINKTEVVRKAVYGVLSPKNYRDIELPRVDYILQTRDKQVLRELGCDALMTGRILKFSNSNLVTYSVTTVELELQLKDINGQLIWSGRHAANSHEGALPLSPLSLVSGMFVAATNKQDEVALQMVDAATRRILSQLPDRNTFDIIAEVISSHVSDDDQRNFEIGDVISAPQLLKEGAYEQAIIIANQELVLYPNSTQLYEVLAEAHLQMGDYKDAIDAALEALSRDGKLVNAYSILGASYIKDGNLRMAEAAYLMLLERDNTSPESWYNLGLIQLAQSKPSDAIFNFENAGAVALETDELQIAYRSLKQLQTLSTTTSEGAQSYQKLGEKVSQKLSEIKNQR